MISKHLWNFSRKHLPFLKTFSRTCPLAPSRSHFSTAIIDSSSSNTNPWHDSYHTERENPKNEYKEREYYYNKGGSLPLMPLLAMVAVMLHKGTSASCLFSRTKYERNKLTNRVELIQYPSNNPIKDRWVVSQIETIPAYVAAVFDGHGGWQLAEYARENFVQTLEKALRENKDKSFENEDEYIKASLKQAFDTIENNFLKIAKDTYKLGFPSIGKVGSCALVTLVYGNKVYSANAGDSKGVLCKTEKGKVTLKKINHKQNASSKREQQRLRQQYTDDDIFVCDREDSKSCYVKNILRPTRALGDFNMKSGEFNNPNNLAIEYGFGMKIESFKGPYITHEPEILVFDLEKNDKYLILSSDGIWRDQKKDEVYVKKVTKIIEKNLNDKQKLASELVAGAVQAAAKKKNITELELKAIRLGHRRKFHDDMTVIVVDLENQIK